MLGTITTLRRYPVKSMLGEDLDAADVSHRGLARDRRLAVVSRRTGKVASAKYPRPWRDLLTLSAEALRVLARHNRVTPFAGLGPEPCAGVYAEVRHQGEIRVGDAVR